MNGDFRTMISGQQPIKHDYITNDVHHSPRKVKRWELLALIACFVLCGVDL